MVVEFTACYSCTGTGFDIATTVHINWEQYFPHIEYIFILHIWDVVPILNPLLCGKIWGWDITRVSLYCTNPRPPWHQTFCDIYKMLHAFYFHVSFMVEALRYDTVLLLWLEICMRWIWKVLIVQDFASCLNFLQIRVLCLPARVLLPGSSFCTWKRRLRLKMQWNDC